LREKRIGATSLRRDWLDHKSSSAKECESMRRQLFKSPKISRRQQIEIAAQCGASIEPKERSRPQISKQGATSLDFTIHQPGTGELRLTAAKSLDEIATL
jgi:hypothetical protein